MTVVLRYDRKDTQWSKLIGSVPEDFVNWLGDFDTTEYGNYIKGQLLFEQCMNAAVIIVESDINCNDSPFNIRCKDAAYNIIAAIRQENPENEFENQEWVYAWTCIGGMIKACYHYINNLYTDNFPINFSVNHYFGNVFKASVLVRKY